MPFRLFLGAISLRAGGNFGATRPGQEGAWKEAVSSTASAAPTAEPRGGRDRTRAERVCPSNIATDPDGAGGEGPIFERGTDEGDREIERGAKGVGAKGAPSTGGAAKGARVAEATGGGEEEERVGEAGRVGEATGAGEDPGGEGEAAFGRAGEKEIGGGAGERREEAGRGSEQAEGSGKIGRFGEAEGAGERGTA